MGSGLTVNRGIKVDPDIDYLLTNAEYVHWLKVVLVMEIADEAVRPFVEKEMKTFQTDIKSKFRNISLCGNCKSTNAQHCNSGKCSKIASEIVSVHRFNEPSYKNSDITKWLSDPWEIAKCYMSKSKDLEGKPGSEIDFANILNVVINNTRFDDQLTPTVDMKDENNIFRQGRKARNDSMHSRSYRTTESNLHRYCGIFIDIVKLICRNSAELVEKTKKVRDTPLSITADDIIKLKEKAAIYQGITDAVVKEMKKGMQEEAERIVKYIQDATHKAIGVSIIPNFVEGCKESLNRFTMEHIKRQIPEHIRERGDVWTVQEFMNRLELLPNVKDLSKRHKEMLFPSSYPDIRKFNLYLLCFVLNIEAHTPLDTMVLKFIEKTKVFRNKLLDDPSVVDKSQLLNLCKYFDEPMKDDIVRIFTKEYTVTDTIYANNVLQSWRKEEEKEDEARYRSGHAEENALLHHKLTSLVSSVTVIERRLNIDRTTIVEHTDSRATEGDRQSHETQVELKPCCVPGDKSEQLQAAMTSSVQHASVVDDTGAEEIFKEKTNGCVIKRISKGSIILTIGCPSMAALFGFWKGCTDGTVVKALSKIEDAYRKHLGCDTLEFDILLTKKEVTRCKLKIIEDLNSRLERLEERITAVNDMISQQCPQDVGYVFLVKDYKAFEDNQSTKMKINKVVDYEPYRIQYGPDPRVFVVMFNTGFTNAGSLKFKKVFRNSVELSATDKVQILHKTGTINEYSIEEAFARRHQSGAGAIKAIKHSTDLPRCWIITFTSEQDARKVWMRTEMIIEGLAVSVFPWYDGLGEAVNFGEKPVFDESDLKITDLDQDKLMFVMDNGKEKSSFEKHVKSHLPCSIKCSQSDTGMSHLIIKCIHKKCSQIQRAYWKDTLTSVVASYFMENIVKRKFAVEGKYFDQVLENVSKTLENPTHAFKFIENQNDLGIVLISSDKNLITSITEDIKVIQNVRSDMKSVMVTKEYLDKYDALDAAGILKAVRRSYPNTMHTVRLDGVKLTGPASEVNLAKAMILELAIHTTEIEIEITREHEEHLKCYSGKSWLEKKLQDNNICKHFKLEGKFCKLWTYQENEEDILKKTGILKKFIRSLSLDLYSEKTVRHNKVPMANRNIYSILGLICLPIGYK